MERLLAVYDGNNALVMRFEYADARMPFAMTMGGATYFLAYDQVGSLRVVADGSGNPVKRIDYDSFGNVFYDSAPDFSVPFGFAGGLYDKDTKLMRFGYRDYDPDTGRWTAKDPIGFAGGDTDLYGYCVGDPVNLTDADGLSAMEVAIPIAISVSTLPIPGTNIIAGGIIAIALIYDHPPDNHAAMSEKGGANARRWEAEEYSDACSGGKKKMPQGDNTKKNEMFKEALRQLGISENTAKARKVHDLITKQGLQSVKQMVNAARQAGFGK